jgi:peptidoglycan/LPS O-acetylase OafA/YrhL
MWHIPIARFGLKAFAKLGIRGRVGWTAANAGMIAVLTVICIGVSELTYRYIERPFLRHKARLA